jgi:hypothetical protein
MNEMPKSIATLNKALATMKMNDGKCKALGVSNLHMASIRSFRFDLPSDKPGTIRRVKLTAAEDGTLLVQLHEVVEMELVPGVLPEAIVGAIKNLTGVDFT